MGGFAFSVQSFSSALKEIHSKRRISAVIKIDIRFLAHNLISCSDNSNLDDLQSAVASTQETNILELDSLYRSFYSVRKVRRVVTI